MCSSPKNGEIQWYKRAVIYQAHVRAFCDSDGNGIGDFPGLTQKLDYLVDLGITALWLLPFYPSPLRDDGYDIADYRNINPIYGTLADFKTLLREAHRRGLRVITELVINHTSDQHAWFQKSRRAKSGSRWRNYYVWSDTPEKYKEARIIFKDFELSNWTWDPVAKAYFWHRFYSHQPDLNFDNPEVHEEIFKALNFWLRMGVDGLRLDAVPYLYERPGTSCENLPETHEFLRRLRAQVDSRYGDRMLLAEANQWPEDAASYFGQGRGDESHMAFHFPLMPRLFMAVRMEDRVPIVDILEQTPAIPETSQWAIFLRNHDELTLEMVTDEERDYMYRVYAQDTRARINLGIRRRLAPLLGNDRKRIELLNALLLSLPGTPVIYYGDEIGMGDNIFLGDRNGVRTPMQWSSDKNAGFSRANPQSLYLPITLDPEYHYEAVNVEAQQRNPHSLLRWTKRLLALRKRWTAFSVGTIEFLQPENRKILAFVRRYEQECILVVCNLSRFVQPVELDLSRFANTVPLEIFGHSPFPPVGDQPYFLTLGPHSFYWFALLPRFTATTGASASITPPDRQELPLLEVPERWDELLQDPALPGFERVLQEYVSRQHWFRAQSRELSFLRVGEVIPTSAKAQKILLLVLKVEYTQGDTEQYQLALGLASDAEANRIQREHPQLIIARLRVAATNTEAILHDAVASQSFDLALFDLMERKRTWRGEQGEVEGKPLPLLRRLRAENSSELVPVPANTKHCNTSIVYGEKFQLKLFRRLETGLNPELELGRFLTEHGCPHVPAMAGELNYRTREGETVGLGILSEFIPNAKNAWEYSLDTLSRYYDRISSLPEDQRPDFTPDVFSPGDGEVSGVVAERLGTYVEAARLLGDRTAAIHLCLESDRENPSFAPEPFTPFYQRSLFQSMRNQAVQNLGALRRGLRSLSDPVRPLAERVLSLESNILARLKMVTNTPIKAMRLRIHGDYHLTQVLHTGKDVLAIDFEGETARSLSERRTKHTPLRDVAGMLRSFHYCAFSALRRQHEKGALSVESALRQEPWARYWSNWAAAIFLRAYFNRAKNGTFLPSDASELKLLLGVSLLHRALFEVGYELSYHPLRLTIPLDGILQIMELTA